MQPEIKPANREYKALLAPPAMKVESFASKEALDRRRDCCDVAPFKFSGIIGPPKTTYPK